MFFQSSVANLSVYDNVCSISILLKHELVGVRTMKVVS
eukprot:SAG11_NODE_39834_length_219_cov_128.366667_1_plen_37_part_01